MLPPYNVAANIHRIHTAPLLPPEIQIDALSAIEKFASQQRVAAMELRTCLERLVLEILKLLGILDLPSTRHTKEGAHKGPIDLVRATASPPSHVVNRMHQVRIVGNKAVHPDDQDVDFRQSMPAFADIAEWFDKWLRKSHMVR